MKPLFIGEAPSKNEPLPKPIEGRIGRRLAAFASISFDEFLEQTERVNLLDVRQDTREKGFEFDREAARIKAIQIFNGIEPNRTVVLLGKRVADTFGFVKDYFDEHHMDNGAVMYLVPHPSGVNRWYNDVKNCRKMNEFMRSILCSR